MTVLVTGGAGFIGSHLVDALVERKRSVRVLDNFSSGSRSNLAQHERARSVELIEGDVRDPRTVHRATEGVETVYHLAVDCLRTSLIDPLVNHEVNATGTLHLLRSSLDRSVRRFVYVSSSEVYGTAQTAPMSEEHPLRPMTVYGASKAAGELYTLAYHRTYGLPTFVVRPFNTYGPREHFEGPYGEVIPRFAVRLLNDLPAMIFGDGKQTRDFTYVSDTVDGILGASECDALVGEAVNVARGREVTVNDLARILGERLGRAHIAPQHGPERPGDVRRHFADIRKAREAFHFGPRTDIEPGIGRYLEWLHSQERDPKELLRQYTDRNWT